MVKDVNILKGVIQVEPVIRGEIKETALVGVYKTYDKLKGSFQPEQVIEGDIKETAFVGTMT